MTPIGQIETLITPDRTGEDYIDSSGVRPIEKPSIFDSLPKGVTGSAHRLEYQPNIDKEPLYPVDKVKKQVYQEDSYQFLGPTIKALLNDIFDRITDANDQELGMSERSNNFDEWRDMLQVLSRVGEDITNHHRKILGTLISFTGEQDISDFNAQELKLFLEASNLLRQTSFVKTRQ